eukprot:GFUD01012545.1.p1 GENE.GFUD01012545.1~~GFUD01012545.1.p1  ORF type:complete len:230 (+),score=97.52 GFUD01012545.1:121-810(+)
MSLHLISSMKLVPSSTALLCQQVRFKKRGKWIVPHRKPRWIPMARSKMFVDPPKSLVPKEEQEHIAELQEQYMRRMKALHMYLMEDDIKNSDTGEAAMIAAQKEEEEHQMMIKLNEDENELIAVQRVARLKNEAEERKLKIAQELSDFDESETNRLAAVDEMVEKHKAEMEKRIRVEDLEKAIETALANPVDFEFAIDKEGHIFRGRTTKCKKVEPENYETIPFARDGY